MRKSSAGFAALVLAATVGGAFETVHANAEVQQADSAFPFRVTAAGLLPTYADGARATADLDLRVGSANKQLGDWRALEVAKADNLGRRIMANGEWISTQSAAPAASGAGRSMAQPGLKQFLPLYAELATVCDVPAAVALYANVATDSGPSVLRQWPEVTLIAAPADSGVSGMWSVGDRDRIATAWTLSAVPDIVTVVSTGMEACSPAALVNQVRPGLGR